MTRRVLIIILVSVFYIPLLRAQEISIKTKVARDSALIGEQFTFSIILNSEKPVQSFVPLDDKLFPPQFEVISESTDSIISESSRIYESNYLVTCFDSGIYTVNAIPVLVNNFEKLDTLFTNLHEIIVYSPEVDTSAAIMDIKKPVNTPFTLSELRPFIPYISGVLLLIISGILMYMYRRRKVKSLGNINKSLPPHIKALESLNKIRSEKLWQKGKTKEYYSALSDTIRTYIEERYNIPAMESITWEILESFKKHSWDDDTLMEILESLLMLSDLVKFAREDPSPSENETNLNNAYIFIEKTKPAVKIEEGIEKND